MDRTSQFSVIDLTNLLPLSALAKPSVSEEDVQLLVEVWKKSDVSNGRFVVKGDIKPDTIKLLITRGLLKGNYVASSMLPNQTVELTDEGKETITNYIMNEESSFEKKSETKIPMLKKASNSRSIFNLKKFRQA